MGPFYPHQFHSTHDGFQKIIPDISTGMNTINKASVPFGLRCDQVVGFSSLLSRRTRSLVHQQPRCRGASRRCCLAACVLLCISNRVVGGLLVAAVLPHAFSCASATTLSGGFSSLLSCRSRSLAKRIPNSQGLWDGYSNLGLSLAFFSCRVR
jgi:hypothetical protein